MKINEVEKLLSVSRSNIRFYEKEGLISPKRKENNYRDYSEHDVSKLKKILTLRKLGFTVEEISSMQKGELSLQKASADNVIRLEKEIEDLKGALQLTKSLSKEKTDFETLDHERLWNEITQAEHSGNKFVDIYEDYLNFERDMADNMWKYVFFHDFAKSRKKYGTLIACGILLLICVIRGISSVVFWHKSFWDGFLYPFVLFAIGTVIVLPIYILSKKSKKAASVISTIISTIGLVFFALCVLALIFGIIKQAVA